jgi:general L-amino acid transport system substrate-binding protein
MTHHRWVLGGVALAVALTALVSGCATGGFGSTLAAIKKRGQLHCGVNGALRGFSLKKKDGTFQGFDVDFCRAIAAAVLGDDRKVTYHALSPQERFAPLLDGRIDVLIRNTTWNLSRDTEDKVHFGPPTFYDGQGFLVRSASGISQLPHLKGKRICVIQGTTSEANLRDTLARTKIPHIAVPVATSEALSSSYHGGQCEVATADYSALVGLLTSAPKPEEHLIIGVQISKEPLAPAVRQGDDQWFDVVRWVIFATIEAEELGVNSANVDQIRLESPNTQHRHLLGVEGQLGAKLGLAPDWAYQIIKRVGNYAEIYDRHLGPRSETPIPRWINKLWGESGILYSPPFR